MANAELPSSMPSPETVFEILDDNPLKPLMLGILWTTERPMTPSEIQQFIVDAAGPIDTEDDHPEPSHDTGEILAACENLQQEELVMISQAEPDTEPTVELTATGQQVGVPAAYDIMERFIAQGHGACHVIRDPNQQKLDIVGMITLGAVGLTAKVAEALDDGARQIEAHVRKLVKEAIRNRPLSRPLAPLTPQIIHPALSGSPVQTKKFTCNIVYKPFVLARNGLELQSGLLPTEVPMSSMRDRPATPSNSEAPVSRESPEPTPDALESRTAHKPHGPKDRSTSTPHTSPLNAQGPASGLRTPLQAGSTNPESGSKKMPNNPAPAPTKKPDNSRKPGKPQGGPQSKRNDSRPPANPGSAESGGGTTGDEGSSIDEIKANLASAIDITDAIMSNFELAQSRAEEAADSLRTARALASLALLPGALNPLAVTPRNLAALADIADSSLDKTLANLTRAAEGIADYAAVDDPQNRLRIAIQNISERL